MSEVFVEVLPGRAVGDADTQHKEKGSSVAMSAVPTEDLARSHKSRLGKPTRQLIMQLEDVKRADVHCEHSHVNCIGFVGVFSASDKLALHRLRPERLHLVVVGHGEAVLQTQSKVFHPRNVAILIRSVVSPGLNAGACIWCQTRTALLVVLLAREQLRS